MSRRTFLRALRERGAVLVCPGGQAEMCHTHRMERRAGAGGAPELVIHARHKGFCRVRPGLSSAVFGAAFPEWASACPPSGASSLSGVALPLTECGPSSPTAGPLPAPPQTPGDSASPPPQTPLPKCNPPKQPLSQIAIEQQAALVPVLALGEGLQLRNLFTLPAIQAYTTRRFRFPFPFVLGGRWGVSPLPSRVPLVYVIGRPIQPPAPQPAAARCGCAGAGAPGGAWQRPPFGAGGGEGRDETYDEDADDGSIVLNP